MKTVVLSAEGDKTECGERLNFALALVACYYCLCMHSEVPELSYETAVSHIGTYLLGIFFVIIVVSILCSVECSSLFQVLFI